MTERQGTNVLTSLPWLPVPNELERQRFAALLAEELSDLGAWRQLLTLAWRESELRRAGSRIRRALARSDVSPDSIGIVPLKLLVVSTHTFSHMSDAVVASALRHGVALTIAVDEYTSPEAWLADENRRADEHDIVLVAADAKGWRLPASLEEDESATLTLVAENFKRVRDGFNQKGARALIFQTVADDLSELAINLDAALTGSRSRLLQGLNNCIGTMAGRRGDLVLDVARLAAVAGLESWWPGRFWFSAKLPFAQGCIPLYADNIGRILAAKVGKSRRALVLDLDNTLWGGIIGDDGLAGIVLGQGSAAGEAHLAIQRIAKAYSMRGVVLCVASKNTHDIAMEAFRSHPDMVLRETDIVATQINWNDKASNIRALAQTLNLGLESFVFVDDNPVERKQVRDVLPVVAVPELPADPADWPLVLQAAGYFEQISLTAEDRQRREFYKSIAERNKVAAETGDTDAFLRSLATRVVIAPFDAVGRKRIAQLISKSNQFNLTTRRYSEAEIEALERDPSAVTMQIRLSDMFGDAGMISVVIGRPVDDALEIDTWLMSCRVLGRRVQEAALDALAERARTLGLKRLHGLYFPTPRNSIVAEHYRSLGFRLAADLPGGTRWELPLDQHVARVLPMTIENTGGTKG